MKPTMLKEERTSLDDAPRLAARGGATQVRRFDGLTQRASDWDGLRKVAAIPGFGHRGVRFWLTFSTG